MAILYQNLQHYPSVIAGPCVIESESLVLEVGDFLQGLQKRFPQVQFLFKASFDKANRTSLSGFRGPGLENGLATLEKVRQQTALPLVTDVHEKQQAEAAGLVVDMLQIPAFLCRQTDLLLAAGKTDRLVNIKKGQFLAGSDMQHPAQKVASTGNEQILLSERGTTFGYHDLVVDFRNIMDMKALHYPVIFDATHSVQQPGGSGGHSSGQKAYVPGLTLAAQGTGVNGFFFEIHPEPESALSDGANMLTLSHFEQLMHSLFAGI